MYVFMRSMCNNSRGLEVWTSITDGCLDFICLPIWHGPHMHFSIFSNLGKPIMGKTITTSHMEIFSNCLWLACPNRWCHKSTWLIFELKYLLLVLGIIPQQLSAILTPIHMQSPPPSSISHSYLVKRTFSPLSQIWRCWVS